MSPTHGHDPGHVPDAEPTAASGLEWQAYVDWLAETEGSLTAAADRLAARRGYKDDVATVERALRRLRHRGNRDGGVWGARALEAFGVPGGVTQRLAWMASYHSRFTDLPVPLCADLVRAWDRPPINGSRLVQAWLALAHASVALRRSDLPAAVAHLDAARPAIAAGPPEVRIEDALVRAYVASRGDPEAVFDLLRAASALLEGVKGAEARACFQARITDHTTYALGRRTPPDHEAAAALWNDVPVGDAPPFVLSRRASGLAYARWKMGLRDEAEALAREAADHAGDGGHVRLRVMALSLLSRIAPGPEAERARARALSIAQRLDDETLRLRLRR